MKVKRYVRSAPLPIPLYHVSSATMGNTWYLLGGYSAEPSKQVVCANLNDLLSQAVSKPLARSGALWQVIASTSLVCSTALVLNGSLLAVGGAGGSSAIYLYQPKKKGAGLELESCQMIEQNVLEQFYLVGSL